MIENPTVGALFTPISLCFLKLYFIIIQLHNGKVCLNDNHEPTNHFLHVYISAHTRCQTCFNKTKEFTGGTHRTQREPSADYRMLYPEVWVYGPEDSNSLK